MDFQIYWVLTSKIGKPCQILSLMGRLSKDSFNLMIELNSSSSVLWFDIVGNSPTTYMLIFDCE